MKALEIVCPFCPLHCDDVRIEAGQLVDSKCKKLNQDFEAAFDSSKAARVDAVVVDIAKAEQVALDLITSASATEVLVRQASLRLARKLASLGSKHSVQVEASATLLAYQDTVRRTGVISATLADVRQHADLIIVLGNMDQAIPRFSERVIKSGIEVIELKRPTADEMADLAYALANPNSQSNSQSNSTVQAVVDSIVDAKFVAFILSPDAFDASQAGPSIETLVGVVLRLNRITDIAPQRAVLVAMNPLATLASVNAWTHNNILQTCQEDERSAGKLSIRLETANQEAGLCDIQIGGHDGGANSSRVFLPASTAGIHHCDAIVRGDGTVTLKLDQIATSDLPSMPEWLSRLGL